MSYVPKAGDVIDDRFTILSNSGLPGGMATVYKATDVRTGRTVALKIASADISSKDGLAREAQLLRTLHPHRHIIGYVAETLVGDAPTIVIEWADHDLGSKIVDFSGVNWQAIFKPIVIPLLSALERAHAHNFQHRDIHPGNIMFSADGELKIIDFGIAQLPQRTVGLTFERFGAPPYTPENQNDRHKGYSRDCYSVAAVIVSCIAGKVLTTYEELLRHLNSMESTKYPVELLRSCIIDYPANCPSSAGILRSQLNHWTSINYPSELSLALIVEAPPASMLTELLPEVTWSEVMLDLAAGAAIQVSDATNTSFQIDISGINYRATFSLVDPKTNTIRVSQKIRLNRAGWSNGFVAFEFSLIDKSNAKNNITWSHFLDAYERAEEETALRIERDRLEAPFRSWDNYLAAEHQLLLKKPSSIKYRSLQQIGEREFRFELENNTAKLVLSEDVSLVSNQNKRNLIRVVEIDDLWVHAKSKHALSLPRSGMLSVEYHALKQAINRKRRALDAVRNNTAPSLALAEYIMSPEKAPGPEFSGRTFSINDPYQAKAVDAAIGVRSWTMIEGPPGTGKSTLIAQIIKNYGKDNGGRRPRVLLAAQTHIAIDTVLEKLLDDGHDPKDMIRIPSGDVDKIEPNVRNLLVENKAKNFRERAIARSEQFMESYAQQRKADHRVIKLAVYTGIYRAIAAEVVAVRARLQAAENSTASTIGDLTLGADSDQAAVTQTVNVVTIEDQVREELVEIENRLRQLTTQIKERVPELREPIESKKPFEAMMEYDDVFRSELAANEHLAELVRLQLDWIKSITAGRALYQTIIQDSSVVAGTCVGIGSVIANQEFDICIVDEASKALPIEALIPMSRAKNWILVGDVKQLPPHVDREIHSAPEDAAWSRTSLLQSLPELAKRNKNTREIEWHLALLNQRRMAKGISDLISEVFYDKELVPLRENSERKPIIAKAYKKPVVWIDVNGTSHEENNRTRSLYNEAEINVILAQLAMIQNVINRGRANTSISIAVIAGYAAQVDRLKISIDERRHQWEHLDISVASIDSFQGNEKDIAIVSLVRGTNVKSVGHLDEKRVNVAMSRAKDALIIVGSALMVDKVATGTKLAEVLQYIRLNTNGCHLTSPQ